MKCNNEYCYWQAFEWCCNVDEERINAEPDRLDCPVSLRRDFEDQLIILRDENIKLLDKCNFREQLEIRKLAKKFAYKKERVRV